MIRFKRKILVVRSYISLLLLVLVTVMLLPSCKKEYPVLPYNDIEQFTIKDAMGNDLKASIQGTDIIVYYPPFQAVPAEIMPSITVSEGATVVPASGSKVPYKSGTTFKVTAADGSIKTYMLKALVNQPVPTVSVNDTRIGDVLVIEAEYLLPDTTQTKLILIDAAKKEIPIPAATFTEFSASRIVAAVPAKVDTGFYQVKIISGLQTVVKGPVHIDRPYLSVALPQTIVKRGGEIIFTDIGGSLKYYQKDFGNTARISYTVRDDVDAQVTGINNSQIKIKVPENYPGQSIVGVTLNFMGNPVTFSPDMGSISVTD